MSSKPKPVTSAFVTPDLVPTSNKTPADSINDQITKKANNEIKLLKLTEGKITSLSTPETFIPYPNINSSNYPPGRTIFIPKNPIPGIIPPPSYNSGWCTGYPCNGPHCGPSVQPTMSGMQYNMKSASFMAQYASKQFPPALRNGNSTDTITNYNMYINGTNTNPGPFNLKVSD
jgi:hypothetical protein